MNIYVGNNELSKPYLQSNESSGIYVGGSKAWPTTFQFSYDFRGKTAAQIQAAGRTIGSKNNVGYNLNTNGLGNLSNGDTSSRVTLPIPINITENNKITFTLGSYGGSTSASAGGVQIGLADGIVIDKPGESANQTSILNASGSSVNADIQVSIPSIGKIIYGTSSYGSGIGYLECVIDFPSNKITYNKTSPVSYSTTHIITAAEKNAILSARDYLYARAVTYSSTTTNYIQTVSIKIE